MAAKKRVLSGMRPTGRLHLGHLVGALENWIRLQEQYQCFFFVADWHALTTDYADSSQITENTLQMAMDWLACGLDPAKATLFIQSHVPEHAELHLLFSMVTPLGWLERVPSYKEQREQIRDRDLGTYGFLGYPLLQSADILIYKAHFVPVGEDQVAHVELTREIVRRFNSLFAYPQDSLFRNRQALALMENQTPTARGKDLEEAKQEFSKTLSQWAALANGYASETLQRLNIPLKHFSVFPEPQPLLTETPKLPGLDGRKMSKSYGNTIDLGEEPDSIRQKVAGMLTDPQRVRRTDPGRPEVCPVFGFHRRHSPLPVIERVDRECRTAGIGCVDCKGLMLEHLLPMLEPIRERRRQYEAKPRAAWEILVEGSKKARRAARRTLEQVREAMHLKFDWERKRPAAQAGRKP